MNAPPDPDLAALVTAANIAVAVHQQLAQELDQLDEPARTDLTPAIPHVADAAVALCLGTATRKPDDVSVGNLIAIVVTPTRVMGATLRGWGEPRPLPPGASTSDVLGMLYCFIEQGDGAGATELLAAWLGPAGRAKRSAQAAAIRARGDVPALVLLVSMRDNRPAGTMCLLALPAADEAGGERVVVQ